jgi:predicted AlkP superfamily pyrophosphatase or phosphodiesterase
MERKSSILELKNKNTIVNFSNSILKHFDLEIFHDSIPEIDKILENHKKVVVLLYDGFGKNIIEEHLKPNSFIRTHSIHTMNATYPPTTVASTNGLLSGRFPIETGWIGWAQYFKDVNLVVEVFPNRNQRTLEEIPGANIMKQYCPYKTIVEMINAKEKRVIAYDLKEYPIDEKGYKNIKEGADVVESILQKHDKCLIYSYYTKPDKDIHDFGVQGHPVHKDAKTIDKTVKRLVKRNPDTLFLVIADHGLIDVEYLDLSEHQDLYELLTRPLSLEKRTITFFIKEGAKMQFEELFDKYYGQYFDLITKEEALKNKIFGDGSAGDHSLEFIGDYIAIAFDKYCLYCSKDVNQFTELKGHHAGFTKEEMEINISAFNL